MWSCVAQGVALFSAPLGNADRGLLQSTLAQAR